MYTDKAREVYKEHLTKSIENIKKYTSSEQLERAYAIFRDGILSPWKGSARSKSRKYADPIECKMKSLV